MDKKRTKKRSISSHVSSRWFRAPEVIVLEKQYDQAVDMWGIGCIIYELIRFTNRAMQKQSPINRKALFPGQYCFPLSPRGNTEEGFDQIDEILKVIGPLTEEDTSYIQTATGQRYVEKASERNA